MGVAIDGAAGAASGVAAGAACGATGAANGAVAGAVLLLLGFCSTRLAEAEGSAVAKENRSLCFFSAGSCEVGTREADASKYWLAADSTEPQRVSNFVRVSSLGASPTMARSAPRLSENVAIRIRRLRVSRTRTRGDWLSIRFWERLRGLAWGTVPWVPCSPSRTFSAFSQLSASAIATKLQAKVSSPRCLCPSSISLLR